MIWTKIYTSGESYNVFNSRFETFYNNSTLLKNRFTFSAPGTADCYYSTALYSIHNKYGGDSGAGMYDSIANAEFATRNGSVYGSELVGTETEIFAFKDDGGHHLINVYGKNDNNTEFWLHAGITTANTNVAYMNKTSTGISVTDFTTAASTMNNNYGTDYIIQPLFVFDEKTPFYFISGNTELPAFTVIQVQTTKFMIVGKGICVEID